MSSDARYVVGIDLGTTNSALAYADVEQARKRGAAKAVEVLELDQLLAAGEVGRRPLLPSTIYLPSEHELAEGALTLPFGDERGDAVGELARAQGAKVPGRVIASAKSWLCHPAVDRRSSILPPGAPADVERLSPVAASARLLEHIRDAWDHRFPDAPLAEQQVVLTVPASFDAIARTLTLEAARTAGIADNLALVEEPQAAFYDYHANANAADGGAADRDQLVLVVDVGGGTTDLTLIRASHDADTGEPTLRRLAVGAHILLGGDNMDMALAHLVERKLELPGGRLDPARWAQLTQSCRLAKETLLERSEDAEGAYRVIVASRGSRLVRRSMSCDLERDEVVATVLDGFLPEVTSDDRPRRPVRTGLAQLGLPYAADAGITRHIAAFLSAHGEPDSGAPARPDSVLLVGGVFHSPVLRERLVDILRGLGPRDEALELLDQGSLSLAVARGAAVFGLARQGIGRRIGGGSAHAYFVHVAAAGEDSEEQALCLIPRGHEIGREVEVADRTFSLVVGQPVQFDLYATAADRREHPGDLVPIDAEEMGLLPPLQTMLPHGGGGGAEVPVILTACIDEVGVLDVACLAVDRNKRWRLEFDLRGASPRSVSQRSRPARDRKAPRGLSSSQKERVQERIQLIYGKAKKQVSKREVRLLRKDLQAAVGLHRDQWTLPMLRDLWELVRHGLKTRRRSPEHESVFFNLAGFGLRPGFGFPLDEWRVRALWDIFKASVQHHHEHKVWNEWWVMWRRVAGGLESEHHRKLAATVKPWLRPDKPKQRGRQKVKKQKVIPSGEDEMLRLLASLERLDPATRIDWGDWLLGELEAGRRLATGGWCMARLGARVPLSGAVHNVVDPDVAERWTARLAKLDWKRVGNAAFAVAHIARRTDDRMRDVADDVRQRVARRLDKDGQPELAKMVREVVRLDENDEARFAGDSLPPGLLLVD